MYLFIENEIDLNKNQMSILELNDEDEDDYEDKKTINLWDDDEYYSSSKSYKCPGCGRCMDCLGFLEKDFI